MPVKTTRPLLLCALGLIAYTLVICSDIRSGRTFNDSYNVHVGQYPWAATTHSPEAQPLHWDQAHTFYPYLVFDRSFYQSGKVPLWNRYSFAGHDFAASGVNLFYYPMTWLFSLVLEPHRVLDALILSHIFFAGIAMLLFLRQFDLQYSAALLGAAGWAGNAFTLSWANLQLGLPLHALLPLSMLFLTLSLRRQSMRWGLVAGLALGLLALGSYPLFTSTSFLLIGSYGAAVVARQLWPGRSSVARIDGAAERTILSRAAGSIALLALPFTVGTLVSAVQILPFVELVSHSGRVNMTFDQLLEYRVPWQTLFHTIITNHVATFINVNNGINLIVTTPILVMSLLGFFHSNKREPVFFALCSVTCILFMIGTPVSWFFYKFIPGFDHLKPLGRIAFVNTFSLCVLASFGADWLFRRLSGPAVQGMVRLSGTTLALLLSLAMVAIVLVQQKLVAQAVLRSQPAKAEFLSPRTGIIDAALAEGAPENLRILAISPFWQGSQHLVWRLPAFNGYDSVTRPWIANAYLVVSGREVLDWSKRLYGALWVSFQSDSVRYDLLERIGVTHLMMKTPPTQLLARSTAAAVGSREPLQRRAPHVPNIHSVYSGQDGVLLKLDNPLPRAFLTLGQHIVTDDGAALAVFAEPSQDFRCAVLLIQSDLPGNEPNVSRTDCSSPGTAQIIEYDDNRLVIETDAKQDAWLVVNEGYAPGWHASVNGRAQPILRGNYMFRALWVTAGRSRVEMTFEPRSYVVGWWTSMATLAFMFACTILYRRHG